MKCSFVFRLLSLAAAFFVSESSLGETFTVINTKDSGAGSLRQAITDANNNGATLDTIMFDIPGAGVHTITPLTQLSTISNPVIIDAYTHPGASANTLAIGYVAFLFI